MGFPSMKPRAILLALLAGVVVLGQEPVASEDGDYTRANKFLVGKPALPGKAEKNWGWCFWYEGDSETLSRHKVAVEDLYGQTRFRVGGSLPDKIIPKRSPRFWLRERTLWIELSPQTKAAEKWFEVDDEADLLVRCFGRDQQMLAVLRDAKPCWHIYVGSSSLRCLTPYPTLQSLRAYCLSEAFLRRETRERDKLKGEVCYLTHDIEVLDKKICKLASDKRSGLVSEQLLAERRRLLDRREKVMRELAEYEAIFDRNAVERWLRGAYYRIEKVVFQ